MSINITGYLCYFLITTFIIVRVGHLCYTNGNIFVKALFPDDDDFCIRLNKILLTGYYLLNSGYCATTLISWNTLTNYFQLLEELCLRTSYIMGIIAVLHYCNILFITKFIKNKF